MMRSRLAIFVFVAWAVTGVAGVCFLNGYELRAARTGPVTGYWPHSSSLQTVPGVATLIMAIHPRCPCSGASVSELERVLSHQHARINAHLLVYQPKGYPADWAMTALVRHAQTARDLNVVFDRGGGELSKFHARASGELWFYDGSGNLLFRGGITAGRGHPGRNAGLSSLISLLEGERPVADETPVFGCSIGGEDKPEDALEK